MIVDLNVTYYCKLLWWFKHHVFGIFNSWYEKRLFLSIVFWEPLPIFYLRVTFNYHGLCHKSWFTDSFFQASCKYTSYTMSVMAINFIYFIYILRYSSTVQLLFGCTIWNIASSSVIATTTEVWSATTLSFEVSVTSWINSDLDPCIAIHIDVECLTFSCKKSILMWNA